MKDLWEQPTSLNIPAHIRALATTALRAAHEGHRDECIGPLTDWLAENIPMLAPFVRNTPGRATKHAWRSVKVDDRVLLTRPEAWTAAQLVILEVLAYNSFDPGTDDPVTHIIEEGRNASFGSFVVDTEMGRMELFYDPIPPRGDPLPGQHTVSPPLNAMVRVVWQDNVVIGRLNRIQIRTESPTVRIDLMITTSNVSP